MIPTYLKDKKRDPAAVSNLKFYGVELCKLLREAGIESSNLAKIHLLDLGSDMRLITKSEIEIPISVLREAGILARVRWLIENQEASSTPRFREIEFQVTSHRSDDAMGQLLPAATTGQKVIAAAAVAHRKTHGTEEEKIERWKKITSDVAAVKSAHPKWTDKQAQQAAATTNKCSTRTVRRALKEYADRIK